MAAHKHSWRYSPGAEHRACECGAEQALQAQQDTCGLRHWGPMIAPPRKKAKAGEGPGRFNFIGNSMIPPGEYVAAKYYDAAIALLAEAKDVMDSGNGESLTDADSPWRDRVDALLDASGRGLPPSSDGT